MYKFALIGAAGYVAPRHIKAIYDNGCDLKMACDPSDSVGILDKNFPNCKFFLEFEQFLNNLTNEVRCDFTSVCSPNYLHLSHISQSLKAGSNVICEKPLVLNEKGLDQLNKIQDETQKNVSCILQLRLLSTIIDLKNEINEANPDKVFDVDLSYFTSRGSWYQSSWKGDERKSGGIAANIGVHFFDLLAFLFGQNTLSHVHYRSATSAAGYLEFEKARVRWLMSINKKNIPKIAAGNPTYRSITVDGKEIEFSNGFTDLHSVSYKNILDGQRFGPEDARAAISMTSKISQMDIKRNRGEHHPLLKTLG